jgi:hypothetical protein
MTGGEYTLITLIAVHCISYLNDSGDERTVPWKREAPTSSWNCRKDLTHKTWEFDFAHTNNWGNNCLKNSCYPVLRVGEVKFPGFAGQVRHNFVYHTTHTTHTTHHTHHTNHTPHTQHTPHTPPCTSHHTHHTPYTTRDTLYHTPHTTQWQEVSTLWSLWSQCITLAIELTKGTRDVFH